MKHVILSVLLTIACLPLFAQCRELRKKVDKFDGHIDIFSPVFRDYMYEPVQYMRVDHNGKVSLYIKLVASAAISAPRKGAFILFEDGSKLEYPEAEVEFDYYKGYHFATAFLEMDEDAIEFVSTKRITDFKLHVYDRELKKYQSERAMSMMKCIIEAQPSDVKSY